MRSFQLSLTVACCLVSAAVFSGCSTTGALVRGTWLGKSERFSPEPYRVESVALQWNPATFDHHPELSELARPFTGWLEANLRTRGYATTTPEKAKSILVVVPESMELRNGTATGAGYLAITVFDRATGKPVAKYHRILTLAGEFTVQPSVAVFVDNFVDAEKNLRAW